MNKPLPPTTILCLVLDASRERCVVGELQKTGEFDVIAAKTAEEAERQLAERSDVQCLLCTYPLSEADGIAFLESLQATYPELPVVFYPVQSSESLAVRALSAGVDEYIEQSDGPDHVDDLANAIRTAIDDNWETLSLRERLKELEAIQQVTELLAHPSARSRKELLHNVTEKTANAFQYPTITEVRLTAGDISVATERFHDADSTLTERTITADGTEITLEVGYLEPRPDADEGPFLAEERALCETLVLLLQGSLQRAAYLKGLEESELLFRQLAENVREVVWVSDPKQEQMLYVNPAYERVWGRPVQSLYADPHSFIDSVHPEDRERIERALAAQKDGEYDEEYRIVRPDGEIRWIHDHSVPVFDDDGSVYRIVGLAEDVTKRKERDQQIAVLNRVLRHNLRNELNLIMGYAEMIAETADGDVADHSEKILAVSDRLIGLTKKQRSVASHLFDSPERQAVDLADVLDGVERDLAGRYPNAVVDVTVPDENDVEIIPYVETAVEELATNAIEHGGDAPTVELSASVTPEQVRIQITDDGPGIPHEEIEILGKQEGPLVHGSGIGLWLVHWIVTGAGGTLEFEENGSGGTTITLQLPRSLEGERL